jgi:hypothetical protein
MRQGCMLSASRNTQSEAASATSSRTRLHSQRAHATVPRPSRQRSSAQLRLHGKSQAHSKSSSQSLWFTKPLHHTVPPFAPHDKPRMSSELRDIFVKSWTLPYSPPGCKKSRSTCSVPAKIFTHSGSGLERFFVAAQCRQWFHQYRLLRTCMYKIKCLKQNCDRSDVNLHVLAMWTSFKV